MQNKRLNYRRHRRLRQPSSMLLECVQTGILWESTALKLNPMRIHSSQTTRKSPAILAYCELPEWRKDNPCILTGYRRETNSWRGCFEGLICWHNESGTCCSRLPSSNWYDYPVNIWSHLIGAIISCTLLSLSFLRSGQSIFERVDALHNYAGQPVDSTKGFDGAGMMLFIFGCTVCFTCSAVFHSSMCHSQSVRINTFDDCVSKFKLFYRSQKLWIAWTI